MTSPNEKICHVAIECRQRGAIGKFEYLPFRVIADNWSDAVQAAFLAAQAAGYETRGNARGAN